MWKRTTSAFIASLAILSLLECLEAFSPLPSSRTRTYNRQADLPLHRSTALQAISPEVVVDAWQSYNDALDANPLLVKSVTASVILGAADLAGQALENKEEPKSDVDFARFARFAIFGLVLQAPWNHFYYVMLDGALPPTPDPFTTTTATKVVIDQFLQAPIFTVLIFAFLGALEGKSLDAIKKQLDDDYTNTMLANWKLWVPATVVNIAFCPPALRVLFLNCVFFFWSIFLSLTLNKKEEQA